MSSNRWIKAYDVGYDMGWENLNSETQAKKKEGKGNKKKTSNMSIPNFLVEYSEWCPMDLSISFKFKANKSHTHFSEIIYKIRWYDFKEFVQLLLFLIGFIYYIGICRILLR